MSTYAQARIKKNGRASASRSAAPEPDAVGQSEMDLLAAVIGRKAAREVLLRHSLGSLSMIERRMLLTLPHVGPRRAGAILALPRLLEALARGTVPSAPMTCSRDVFSLYRLRLGCERTERFVVLALNARNALLAEETAAIGTVNTVHVNPAQVLRPAVIHSATSIICLHNHPSGDPAPSPEDRLLTERIAGAAALLGVRFLDHIIITAGSYFSFSDTGQL